MRRREVPARAAAIAAGACICALALVGCGQSKQDAREASGAYTVSVADASFPAAQAVAKPTRLAITVRNTGAKPVPDVAVTVNSLTYRATHPPKLADPERPTWIVYEGPGPPTTAPPVESEEVTRAGGGETANTHTWSLGRLAPGQSKTFAWKLLPVVSGTKTIHYEIAAGLHGRATAQLSGGGRPVGSFTVHIAPAPRSTHVDPETGAVVQGPYSVTGGPVGAVP